MKEKGWYNGYPWSEREAKFEVLTRRIASGEQSPAAGPCDLCGDDEVPVEYHDEDYSPPYLWDFPALLALCRNCHRNKLHMRFRWPAMWRAFLAHVRRGGYAREFKDPKVKKEVALHLAAIARGETSTLSQLHPYRKVVGEEWFANLRMNIESLSDPNARPRP